MSSTELVRYGESSVDVEPAREELATRENDGILVSLVWEKGSDQLSVSVLDTKNSDAFELPATSENWKDVFNHPYAYAKLRSDFVGLLPEFPQAA
jgi:hypothetical protein